MSFIAAAAIVGGAALAGSYMQSQAAKSAASQYANAAQQGINYSQGIYNDIGQMTWPYRGIGTQANNALGSMMPGQYMQYDQEGKEMGMVNGSGYLTAQPTMDDMTKLMPNYKFGLDQGMGQFKSQINAGGGLISGNAIQGGQQFAQDYAGNALQQGFNNYQANRQNVAQNVMNASNIGQGAVGITSNAGTGTASNVSNMLSSIGNAQAQATMGSANAYAGGLNTISNMAMLYAMKGGGGSTPPTSDIRTKQNIEQVGWLPNGLPVYTYEYKDEFKNDSLAGPGRYVGVMAHEVEKIIPDAVSLRSDGYKMVDYSKV